MLKADWLSSFGNSTVEDDFRSDEGMRSILAGRRLGEKDGRDLGTANIAFSGFS